MAPGKVFPVTICTMGTRLARFCPLCLFRSAECPVDRQMGTCRDSDRRPRFLSSEPATVLQAGATIQMLLGACPRLERWSLLQPATLVLSSLEPFGQISPFHFHVFFLFSPFPAPFPAPAHAGPVQPQPQPRAQPAPKPKTQNTTTKTPQK